MRLIHAIRQRIADWLQEQRINDLAACALAAAEQGNSREAMFAWKAMRAQIAKRSPQQVARMEVRRGLRNA